jgi:hypothetical protein
MNPPVTSGERSEAEHHVRELTAWLDAHPTMNPMNAVARTDRARELRRWQHYLDALDRKKGRK